MLLIAAQELLPSKCKMKIEILANNDYISEQIIPSDTCMNDINKSQTPKIQIFSFFLKNLIL